jgi:hypothetical protein
MDGHATPHELSPRTRRRLPAALVCALACVLVLSLAAGAQASAPGTGTSGSGSQQTSPPAPGSASATLEECVTAPQAEQRAVSFSAEMTAVAGTMRMAMRIDLEERLPGETEFHAVTAQGIGSWRSSDPKVKVYKYLKQVTNLSAPAAYRGFVRFRWLNAKGHVIRRTERLTARCAQPAPPVEPGEARSSSGTAAGGAGATAPAA